MVLEQEIRVYMLIGFIIIWLIIGVFLFLKWKHTRNKGIVWFVGQFLSQCVCFYLFTRLINFNKGLEGDMLSGFNSLTIGFMTLVWGMSMIFMIVGVLDSLKYAESKNKNISL
ncbi:hypothetical protein J0B03_07675 [Alkalibacter rhizosphaerae]|uniref:Uncharacterized protein n=1 Tax=Alkalibacter rhizosphaerae TaxID=2815577 RepID=A0A974XDA5_9FIRM|nr:hypothetical protein [Alkalibacter rhizosphaerae]QSX07709.1 hypothetical protein J0B03_07675 [Alkalibacter rhizosphaerae]